MFKLISKMRNQHRMNVDQIRDYDDIRRRYSKGHPARWGEEFAYRYELFCKSPVVIILILLMAFLLGIAQWIVD